MTDRIVRGPNAERREAMRLRLIRTAVECLHEVGYAASTTTEVLNRAGVSRGALLHHFPTKVDLMLETAAHIVAVQTAWYDSELERIEVPLDRLLAMTPITWEALKRPSGMALLEILMATRSDPELARRFPVVARSMNVTQQRGMWLLAKAAGISDRVAVRTMMDTLLGTLRGLSVQLLFADDPELVENAANLLFAWKREYVTELLAREKQLKAETCVPPAG